MSIYVIVCYCEMLGWKQADLVVLYVFLLMPYYCCIIIGGDVNAEGGRYNKG